MKDRMQLGRKIRAEVLGEETVRRRLDQADAFNKDFQELITEFCSMNSHCMFEQPSATQ
jgi:hypothetical protein